MTAKREVQVSDNNAWGKKAGSQSDHRVKLFAGTETFPQGLLFCPRGLASSHLRASALLIPLPGRLSLRNPRDLLPHLLYPSTCISLFHLLRLCWPFNLKVSDNPPLRHTHKCTHIHAAHFLPSFSSEFITA